MTTQSSPRARVNMLLSSIHRTADAFFRGVTAILVMAVFLCAVAFVAVPIGHTVWSYWHVAMASLQAPAPAKKGDDVRGRK